MGGAVQSISRNVTRPFDVLLDILQSLMWKNPSASSAYLKGNFGPVSKELLETNLKVIGEIPKDLIGEFVRNGPNPKFIPRGGYHWFDGDGMLHGVRLLPGGNVSYVNRFTTTDRFLREQRAGFPLYTRIGEMKGVIGFLKLMYSILKEKLNVISGETQGTANTSVQFHNGKLQAFVENDHPYAVKILLDGQFETEGRMDYDGHKSRSITAHPKIDQTTGEMIFYGSRIDKDPFVVYSVADANGKVVTSFEVPIPKPVMMHDMAITTNHSIILDLPLEFSPKGLFTDRVFDFIERPSRLAVFPRHGKQEDIRWFEFQPGFIFHTINAWEEGSKLFVLGCRSSAIRLSDLVSDENESAKEKEKYVPIAHRFMIDLETGETNEEDLLVDGDQKIVGEFPVVDPRLLGQKTQFAYIATLSDQSGRENFGFDGVVKVDLLNNRIVGKIHYGAKKTGGECVFVPRMNLNGEEKDASEEDDGYLLTFVFDEESSSSFFYVMDAKSMAPDPLAIVPLPQRVRYLKSKFSRRSDNSTPKLFLSLFLLETTERALSLESLSLLNLSLS